MNTYYTAKDIEGLADSGTKELMLGPGVFLTDYARETAQQLGIALVRSESNAPASKPAASLPKAAAASSSKYNKPPGCEKSSNSKPQTAARAQTQAPPAPSNNGANSTTVNKLIDLMGKVVKRGN